jgi:pyrroline-5-carboxylate reductase
MAGYGAPAACKRVDLPELRNAVVSKGGTTEAGLTELTRNGGLAHLMSATTEAAYARAVELR